MLMLRRIVATGVWCCVVVMAVACGGDTDGAKSGGHSHGGRDAFNTSLVSDDVIANVTVDPAKTGKVELHMEFTPPGGSLLQVTSVVGNLIPSDTALSTIILWFEKDGSNHFHYDVSVPTPGTWTLEFDATLEDGSTALYTTPVTFES
jgi:hypothetical protein